MIAVGLLNKPPRIQAGAPCKTIFDMTTAKKTANYFDTEAADQERSFMPSKNHKIVFGLDENWASWKRNSWTSGKMPSWVLITCGNPIFNVLHRFILGLASFLSFFLKFPILKKRDDDLSNNTNTYFPQRHSARGRSNVQRWPPVTTAVCRESATTIWGPPFLLHFCWKISAKSFRQRTTSSSGQVKEFPAYALD